MRILVTGATGLVGSALMPSLTAGGHQAVVVSRSAREGGVWWDPASGSIDHDAFEDAGAVVHLAGETIMGRWTAAKKQRIRESRVVGTRLLAENLAALKNPPTVLVCASATGYYGDRGDAMLDEESEPGHDFLAGVCQAWERAADPARAAGIRVTHLRFGIVLTPKGGAMAQLLLPFRLGVGGKIGAGRQYMSWIALDDVIGIIHHAIATESLRGPVNTVAPAPVTNAEFTKTLGEVLHRPTIMPLPAFALKITLGEMAEALLLSSQRVSAQKVLAGGYQFRYPDLKDALKHLLGK